MERKKIRVGSNDRRCCNFVHETRTQMLVEEEKDFLRLREHLRPLEDFCTTLTYIKYVLL